MSGTVTERTRTNSGSDGFVPPVTHWKPQPVHIV
jgi:hypothetical protein